MIAKEWRDTRWKLLIIVVAVVLLVFFLMPTYQEIVAETMKYAPNENPVSNALRDLNDVYYLVGFFVLLPFAALLGVASISAEVSNGTILLPLSRPISRVRLLLIKYLVGAGTLLVAAVLGKLLLVAAGAVRGYPIGQLRIMEVILSVLVLWLGVLSVLGIALLVSIIFRSVVACASSLLLVFALPWYIVDLAISHHYYPSSFTYVWSERVALLTYWMPANYYYRDYVYGIGGFALTNFLVCLISAAVPLLAALWLFNRKAY